MRDTCDGFFYLPTYMKPSLKDKLKSAISKSNEIKAKASIPHKKIAQTAKKITPMPKKTVQGSSTNLSDKQQKMHEKLKGSQFRVINESLYTTESKKSFEKFKKDPTLFEIYHEGFHAQAQKWPVNPVDIYINQLKDLKDLTIADMGCGKAKIGSTLHKQLTIHSFDLVKGNKYITACDISNCGLKDNSCDIVIFCLSLMGTNFKDFLLEARRILKKK